METFNTSLLGDSWSGGDIDLKKLVKKGTVDSGALSIDELKSLAKRHTGDPYWLAGDIDVRDIQSDVYQRDIDEPRLRRMIREVREDGWNPIKAGQMTINVRRDGTVYMMDGQHRTMTIMAVDGIAPFVQRCVVYIGLTREQEAEYFSSTQDAQSRRPVLPAQIHNARLYMDAGNPASMQSWRVEEIVQKHGFYIAESTKPAGSVRLAAVKSVFKIEERYGEDVLSATLEFIVKCWGTRPSPESKVVEGVAQFIAMFPDANYGSLARRLQKWMPKTFVTEAFYRGEAAEYKGRVDQVTYFIHREYNSIGRRLEKLPNFDDALKAHKTKIRSEARRERK